MGNVNWLYFKNQEWWEKYAEGYVTVNRDRDRH